MEKESIKEIGSSLEAELKIITNEKNFKLLEDIDLAEYFITSKAEKVKGKNKEELNIEVTKAKELNVQDVGKFSDNKCERCEKAIKQYYLAYEH